MFHAQVFAVIARVESPEIHDLIAMGIDDFDGLALGQVVGFAGTGGNEMAHQWKITDLRSFCKPKEKGAAAP